VQANLLFSWASDPIAETYDLEIAADLLFNAPVFRRTGITWHSVWLDKLVLLPSTRYYWRVNATNAAGTGPWSQVRTFVTTGPPSRPVLLSPDDGANLFDADTTFRWSRIPATLSYSIVFSRDTGFSLIALERGVNENDASINLRKPYELFYWRVRALNSFGAGPWSATRSITTGWYDTTLIVVSAPSVPRAASCHALQQNYPNPFTERTAIRYRVTRDAVIELSIFNTLGFRVRTVFSGQCAEGTHIAEWNGEDERGALLPGGVYFCRLNAGSVVLHRTMLLVR
jgi:hypothetical protein